MFNLLTATTPILQMRNRGSEKQDHRAGKPGRVWLEGLAPNHCPLPPGLGWAPVPWRLNPEDPGQTSGKHCLPGSSHPEEVGTAPPPQVQLGPATPSTPCPACPLELPPELLSPGPGPGGAGANGVTMTDLESKVASQTNKKEEERKKWPARFLPHSLSQHLGPSCRVFTAWFNSSCLEEPLLKAPGSPPSGLQDDCGARGNKHLRDCRIVVALGIVWDDNTDNHNTLGFLQAGKVGITNLAVGAAILTLRLRCEGSGPGYPLWG